MVDKPITKPEEKQKEKRDTSTSVYANIKLGQKYKVLRDDYDKDTDRILETLDRVIAKKKKKAETPEETEDTGQLSFDEEKDDKDMSNLSQPVNIEALKTAVKQFLELNQGRFKSEEEVALAVGQLVYELHYGGSDGKQPHKDGTPQSVHGGGQPKSADDPISGRASPESLLKRIKTKGFSIQPALGKIPKTGYMTAFTQTTEKKFKPADMTAKNIADFAREHMDLYKKDKNAYFGGWYNSKDDMFYLDVSINIQDKAEAMKVAKNANQIAVWDLNTSTEIDTEEYFAANPELSNFWKFVNELWYRGKLN